MKRVFYALLGLLVIWAIILTLKASASYGIKGTALGLTGWLGLFYFLFHSHSRRLWWVGALISLGLLAAPTHWLSLAKGPRTSLDYAKPSATTPPPGALRRSAAPSPNEPNLWVANPLQGVYHPQRLQILNPWVSAVGVVRLVRREADGDYHVRLEPVPDDRHLINARNVAKLKGDLLGEIIPADQGRVSKPRAGETVRLTGPWVLDRDHGWNEIHPVRYMDPASP